MKKHFRFLILILPLFAGCEHHPHGMLSVGTATPATSGTKTIMLWGQSNMRGVPAGDFPPIANVVNDWHQNLGPGYVFAGIMAARENVTVRLVSCSGDGSSMADFSPGGRGYQPCLDRIAQEGGKIDLILAWQGEAESQLPYQFPWAMTFHQVIDRFRQKMLNPSTPVIYCQLGITTDYVEYPNFDNIKMDQITAQTRDYHMVTIDDIPHPLVDSVHYNHEAVEVVGGRLYQAYTGLEK